MVYFCFICLLTILAASLVILRTQILAPFHFTKLSDDALNFNCFSAIIAQNIIILIIRIRKVVANWWPINSFLV